MKECEQSLHRFNIALHRLLFFNKLNCSSKHSSLNVSNIFKHFLTFEMYIHLIEVDRKKNHVQNEKVQQGFHDLTLEYRSRKAFKSEFMFFFLVCFRFLPFLLLFIRNTGRWLKGKKYITHSLSSINPIFDIIFNIEEINHKLESYS